ncbi:MFS transporter [Actinoplanes sp. CA-142083]|uniref:MFS transporter n=1 Tax=Actinoplanes sp. CA-142083 TaxID=3239903 RepID=UPI003D915A72
MESIEREKHRSMGRKSLTLALCGGYFLVLLDVTVVNVALPSIGAGLGASSSGLAWVVDAYTVPLAALLLAAGAVGDRLGHRTVVLSGFIGFFVASVICAVAWAVPVLIAGRALQGVSAALMLPGTLALLSSAAPSDQARARVVGLWAAVGGCALPAGPFIGGLLVQGVGWRAVFWLNVPVILLALLPVLRPAQSAAGGRGERLGVGAGGRGERLGVGAGGRVDWLGAGVLAMTLGVLVTAIIERAPLLLLVAVVGAVVLRVVERRADPPLLTVSSPARWPLAAACGVAGLMNFCVLGSLFLLTQLFQDVHGLSPLIAGLLLLPGMLPLPLLGAPAGRLVHQIGAWRTSALGLGLAAVGFVGIAFSVGRPVYPMLLVALAVWGAGLGVLTPAIVTAAMRTVPSAPGIASGASNTARQTGGALGVALFAAIAGSAAASGFARHAMWLFAAGAVVFAAEAVFGAVYEGAPVPAGAPAQR